jgi:hypothetical protein
MKLKNVYLYDECDEVESLFEKLDKLQDEGKINYNRTDGWSFSIKDIELTEDDEWDLVEFFEEMDIYPSYDDDTDSEDWDNEEDWD